jgi:hypothetical protein
MGNALVLTKDLISILLVAVQFLLVVEGESKDLVENTEHWQHSDTVPDLTKDTSII